MFRALGQAVARFWVVLLLFWIVAIVGVKRIAPDWQDVVRDGEFTYLPQDVPSRQGENLFKRAFTRDLLGSSVYVVVRRQSREEGLLESDKEFIDQVLKPRIEEISDEQQGQRVISKVRTFSDKSIGHFLESKDHKASLVAVELTTEFLKRANRPTIAKIEDLVRTKDQNHESGELQEEQLIPPGLDLALTGSATVGRDMRLAAEKSADATHLWTLVLVVGLLLIIYRAPLLVLIPLLTVYVSVEISLKLLSLLALAGYVDLFAGIEVYSTVVMYGAGVDYCMFLIARYKEELDDGATFEEATAHSIAKVGAALAASAGTTMCGIGMMVFAEFGKFRQAGIAMSFGLFFVLCASLTFTPALLRLAGRWAFWPKIRSERITAAPGWISPTSLMVQLMERNWLRGLWEKVGQGLLRRPGTIWLASVGAMLPFAVIAVLCYGNLSYGLLSELPTDAPSVVGAKAFQKHFPAGQIGPVTVVLENHNVDFTEGDGRDSVKQLATRLFGRRNELGIFDIRTVAQPFGMTSEARKHYNSLSIVKRVVARKKAENHYVSDNGELSGHVARMDVVFEDDPFSRDSIRQFDRLQKAVVASLPEALSRDSQLFYVGATASIRDLKTVTGRDQIRIDILVLLGVFLILVGLLSRQPLLAVGIVGAFLLLHLGVDSYELNWKMALIGDAMLVVFAVLSARGAAAISGYLILSVFFSYLVTLGVTFAVFWSLDPAGFSGLDWKVPMFLFTILIAVGEDYNIYLITRIEEEQKRHGKIKGITEALSKTGKIISGCGFIMAGTFSSLVIGGSLVGMKQLGFALAFGVLLDTFVVRTILVPAYLILLHSGRFGFLGRFLGAADVEFAPVAGLTPPLRIGKDGSEP